MKRKLLLLVISVAAIVLIGKAFFSPQGIDPIPESQVELTKVIDEMTFKLTDKGDLYRVIYSSLEIGISAHSYGDKPCELWVDDIEVSNEPLVD